MKTTRSAQSLAIIGATRGVGLRLVREALTRGATRLRLLVRDAGAMRKVMVDEAWPVESTELIELIEGDATDVSDVRRVVSGVDAVLFAIGAPARNRGSIRTLATRAMIAAMRAEGVKRVVAVSVFGAYETRAQLPFFLRMVIFPFVLSRVVRDHEGQEALLSESDLEWTAVRPPNLVDARGRFGFRHGQTIDSEQTMTRLGGRTAVHSRSLSDNSASCPS
ncbi:MAG: NAD(P)H-binding protein [Myxococcota bacterium]